MNENEQARTGAQDSMEALFDNWHADDAPEEGAPGTQDTPSDGVEALFDNWHADDMPEEGEPGARDAGTPDGAKPADAESGKTEAGGEEPRYTVKFYGREMQLPVSELGTMAQKGMDYDNVRRRADAAAPVMQALAGDAAASGMDVEQYVRAARAAMHASAVDPLVARGMPRAEAEELAALRAEKAGREADARAMAQQGARAWPYMQLLNAYPEILETGALPPQVTARIDAGETPLEAYRAYDNERLRAQIRAEEAARRNLRSAPSSAAGYGPNSLADSFAAGFDSTFNA